MSYSHAAELARLADPCCRDCGTAPAWTRSDHDGRPLCGACNLTEQKG